MNNPMTDNITVTLKSCPFCGGEATMSYYSRTTGPKVAGYYVECDECSAGGSGFDIEGGAPDREDVAKAEAITAWNTRTEAKAAELLREARETLRTSHYHLRIDDAAKNYHDFSERVIARIDTHLSQGESA